MSHLRMSTQENLKVGKCKCQDDTGGCGNAKSSCACDGGAKGSCNNDNEKADGCARGNCGGSGSNGKGEGEGGDAGKGGGSGTGSGSGTGGGSGTEGGSGSGGGCGGGGGKGGNSAGGCGGGGNRNSGGGNSKSGGGCSEKKETTPYKPVPPFCCEKVRKVLKNILLELLDHSYSEILSNNLSQNAVSCVRRKVKEMKFDSRYKYVCFISVAERGQHNLPVIARTLWNPDSDKCACFSYRTCTTLSTILCFGLIS